MEAERTLAAMRAGGQGHSSIRQAHHPRFAGAEAIGETRLDAMTPEPEPEKNTSVEQSLAQARAAAVSLLEGAIAAHARAEAIDVELKREIDRRKQVEASLQATEQRYRRMVEAIARAPRLSPADLETLLVTESPSR